MNWSTAAIFSFAILWRTIWTVTTPACPAPVESFQANAAIQFGAQAADDYDVQLDRCVWLPTAPINAAGLDHWQIQQVLGDDPAAIRWVVAGDDGVPGHLGWDDDGNGVVDDDSELGAAWSDDFILVTASAIAPDGPAKSVGIGGFRPIDGTYQPTRWRIEIGPTPAFGKTSVRVPVGTTTLIRERRINYPHQT